jgi:hypothetical protein
MKTFSSLNVITRLFACQLLILARPSDGVMQRSDTRTPLTARMLRPARNREGSGIQHRTE